MKKIHTLLLALTLAGTAFNANAQGFKMPQASSSQTITQEFGLGSVTVTYSRPNTKGRKIFGGLEPYGQVWRTGANSATVIKFSDEVTIEGNKVPAGEYALFTIPDAKEWTVILNKNTKQWGAYEYKQADDVLRFKVKPMKTPAMVETFTIQFNNVTTSAADMYLAWENTALNLHLTTDIDARVMAGIDAAMKGEKKPYFNAIQYYYENNKDMKKALEWATEAEKTNPKATYYKLWKARVQLKLGDKAGAIATAQEGVKLAKEEKNDEYVRLNEAVIAQAKK
jgi:tetratricopeptide (TPR) repeat protein